MHTAVSMFLCGQHWTPVQHGWTSAAGAVTSFICPSLWTFSSQTSVRPAIYIRRRFLHISVCTVLHGDNGWYLLTCLRSQGIKPAVWWASRSLATPSSLVYNAEQKQVGTVLHRQGLVLRGWCCCCCWWGHRCTACPPSGWLSFRRDVQPWSVYKQWGRGVPRTTRSPAGLLCTPPVTLLVAKGPPSNTTM